MGVINRIRSFILTISPLIGGGLIALFHHMGMDIKFLLEGLVVLMLVSRAGLLVTSRRVLDHQEVECPKKRINLFKYNFRHLEGVQYALFGLAINIVSTFSVTIYAFHYHLNKEELNEIYMVASIGGSLAPFAYNRLKWGFYGPLVAWIVVQMMFIMNGHYNVLMILSFVIAFLTQFIFVNLTTQYVESVSHKALSNDIATRQFYGAVVAVIFCSLSLKFFQDSIGAIYVSVILGMSFLMFFIGKRRKESRLPL